MEEETDTVDEQSFGVAVAKVATVCFVASAAWAAGWVAPFVAVSWAERRAAKKAEDQELRLVQTEED